MPQIATRLLTPVMTTLRNHTPLTSIRLILPACSLMLLSPLAMSASCPTPANDDWMLEAAATGPDDDSVVIDAQWIQLVDESTAILTGDVITRQQDAVLQTDSMTADQNADRIEASGNVRYQNLTLRLKADQATSDFEQTYTDLISVDYRLNPTDQGLTPRGTAAVMNRRDEDSTSLTDATFTTCPGDSDQRPDWQIRADSIELDHQTGRGKARDMRLRFKDVTLMRLPYASFPIDDRRTSGFLYPSIGSSNDDGLDLSIPWYWNIADNLDATITPRWIGERGAMLTAEGRYLTERSAGIVEGSYLPEDDRTDRHRGLSNWQHKTRFSDLLSLNLNLNHVSDPEYFEDLGDSLYDASRSFLASTAQLSARGDWWQARLQTNSYERLKDATTDIYERLPRLVFSGKTRLGESPLLLNLQSELSWFELDRQSDILDPLRPDGQRFDLYPSLSWPIYRPGYFLEPSLGLRHTRYDLDRSSNNSPDRTTAIASLDAGLVFERSTDRWTQTLEPRAYYLYVPFEEQGDIPLFDSRELTFGFSQLFRPNRFTGADRQADANQLSLAVTTRLIEPASSDQFLEASLGTIVYFRDQRIQLQPGVVEDDDSSPLVGEVRMALSRAWFLQLGTQYDPDDREFDQALASINYRIPGQKLLNISYRKRIGRIEQVDLSVLWPLNERWNLIGRGNYSLMDDTIIEGLLGVEYNSCCWATRVMARRYIRNNEGARRNALYFEIELKGLGSFGRKSGSLLQRSIRGYRTDDFSGF